ncbi:MAG: hypothetical protein ACLQPH_05785 [Acidimicrobiales bacterium]
MSGDHVPARSLGDGRPPGRGTQGQDSVPGRTGGFGPFVTFIEFEHPDGLVARWDSRRQRKHTAAGRSEPTWWVPTARGWWIGALFAVGSALFAFGAAPGYAEAVGARADSVTFFVGSIFFTSAGFLQYRESVDAGLGGKARGWRRAFTFAPHQIDWWATGVQLIGTLYFNVSTGNAVRINLSAESAHQHVWRPDAVGSVCFLVASGLAWFEVCGGWVAWSPGRISWWITGLNLIGSIAFGCSAVAGYIVPSTGQIWNAELSNLGTFVGAVCFLVGAVLLLPERTEGDAAPSMPPSRTP